MNINTIPVLLGEEMGKKVIGILVFLASISIIPILNLKFLYLPSIICGGIGTYLVMKREWNEKVFFINYFVYIFIIGAVWIISKSGVS